MHVFIGGNDYHVNAPFATGGEGDIYKIDPKYLAKIYHDVTVERQKKVLALCNSFANNAAHLGIGSYAFPEQPAYNENKIRFEYICGFAMKFFPDCPSLEDIGYDRSNQQFKSKGTIRLNDEKAVDFIYNTFESIERLHKSRIILGDINPSNLLYNPKTNHPVIIDLDAAQVGQFPCIAWSEKYLDPLIQQQGRKIGGGYTYSYESDIFSIACICFELLVGVNPFFLRSNPPHNIIQAKEKGISILRYIHEKTNIINGVEYLPNEFNDSIKSRILTLKSKHPKLFEFFASIFIRSDRINLMHTLNRNDPRHPAYIFHSQMGFDEVLKDILNARQKTRGRLPINPMISIYGSMAVPASGFSTNSDILSQIPSTLISPTKGDDPKQLLMFLKNYALEIDDLAGET